MKKKFSGILTGLAMIFLLAFPVTASEVTTYTSAEDPAVFTVTASEDAVEISSEDPDASPAAGSEGSVDISSEDPDAFPEEASEDNADISVEDPEESGEADQAEDTADLPPESSVEESADYPLETKDEIDEEPPITVYSETAEAGTAEAEAAEAGTAEAETVEAETVEAETVEAETAETAPDTGVMQDPSSGKWYYYKNGKIDTSYTGFATNDYGTWYVESGQVTKKTNGVFNDASGAIGSKSDWYYVLNSKVQYGFTGLANYKNASGWWYITKGRVDRTYNGLAKNINGWYYLTNGKVDYGYTGFATNSNGSWYIEKGKLERDENTVIKDTNGVLGSKSDWYYVVNSKVQSSFTGLANYKNASGWWYITKGRVDRTYNGLAKNKNGWYYLTNGKVDRSYTGFATNANGSWYIEKGKLERDESTVIKDTNGALGSKSDWYYVVKSKVQFGFTGVASNSNGTWYITKGKVDRSYNGTYTDGKATYTIKNGKVTKKTGGYLVCIDPGHQTYGNSAKEAIGPGSSTTKAKVSSGTRGVSTGLAEYQLNLTVSLKLRDELEARGYDVLMTRTTNDVNISNIERTTMANNANADILVHIHANGDSSSSVNGITVACPSASNPYVSNMYSADRALASSILNHMVSSTGAKNLGLWITDDMTGLNWAKMPAVIVEMGFMTNPTEDQNMSKDSYQNKIVKGIADGIDEYFGLN